MTVTTLPSTHDLDSIEEPTTTRPYDLDGGIVVLPSYLPVPGTGVLPAHAFVLDGPEPMVIDTGPGGAEETFQQALTSVVDPDALRWLWLTHTDPDHIGSLGWLLDTAPNLRIVTTFLAVGKLGMHQPVPMDRLLWVNPGETVELNGRHFEAIRPPSFDAPETVAIFDHTASTFFAADSFGALLHRPYADADELDRGDLTDGMALWASIDSPWLAHTDRPHLLEVLDGIRQRAPRQVLSSHLPPATGMTEVLLDTLARVPGGSPWIGPDQAALDQLLAAVTPEQGPN